MRLIIAAVGRMKSGPEQELISRYVDRIEKAGKAVGITSASVIELPESRAASSDKRKDDEASALLDRLPSSLIISAAQIHYIFSSSLSQ